ncbi:MAG TPA: hypothetical protein VJ623_15305 [Holophagaceae bacterium]|nr:hypothetical protein [Holophagaceae bacterium]
MSPMFTPESAPGSESRLSSPRLALAFSVIPGLGHLYLGYPRRGLLHLLAVGSLVTILSANLLGRVEPLFILLLCFAAFHTFVDAYRRALLLRETLGALETPPREEGDLLSPHGQLWAGLLLMGGGLLALLSVRFGISFAWLLDWWPVAIILLGALLFAQALKDRAATTPEA